MENETSKEPELFICDNVFGERVVVFEHKGFQLYDPYLSECGRFEVHPSYYGISDELAKAIKMVNDRLRKSNR